MEKQILKILLKKKKHEKASSKFQELENFLTHVEKKMRKTWQKKVLEN